MAPLVLLALFAADTPTFNKDVAPILNAACASCHRKGEVGPFPLLTHADAKKRAKQIAAVTGRRLMPPWKPEPGHGEFEHDRRLSAEQIAVLKAWAAAGAPEGDGRPPAMPKFPEGWHLGKPDLILKVRRRRQAASHAQIP